MKTVENVLEEIKIISEEKNHDNTRVVKTMKEGQVIRQGDVYIKKVSSIPSDYNIPTLEMQIAKGDTKGARHIIEETENLRIFKKISASPLEGPAITSKENICITHPEHTDFIIPAGNYICTYQQNFAVAEIKAVRD